MSIRIAVIGAGIMGSDHAAIVASDLPGAQLQLICDTDAERAHRIADELGAHEVASDAMASVVRTDIDAVIIASPDDTHAALTIAAIEAGKPVLCEKPLAPTSRECLQVIAAEVNAGRKLVQTGFMRRFDPPYAEMKAALDSGAIGKAVMMHNFHRNMKAPDWFKGQMAISSSAPHEFDIARYVLGAEFRSITAFEAAAIGPFSPVVMALETEFGQLVTIEVNNNAAYGYDVQGELVGERGSVSLKAPSHSVCRMNLRSSERYPEDWRARFAEAYRLQDKAWLASITADRPDQYAADAWDGYCAAAVAEAGIASLATRARAAVALADKPSLYS